MNGCKHTDGLNTIFDTDLPPPPAPTKTTFMVVTDINQIVYANKLDSTVFAGWKLHGYMQITSEQHGGLTVTRYSQQLYRNEPIKEMNT